MRHNRSHTKSGPGRYHGQGAMTVHEGVRYVKPSQPRFPVAVHGGNWKGVKYLSYREHDELTRARLVQS